MKLTRFSSDDINEQEEIEVGHGYYKYSEDSLTVFTFLRAAEEHAGCNIHWRLSVNPKERFVLYGIPQHRYNVWTYRFEA